MASWTCFLGKIVCLFHVIAKELLREHFIVEDSKTVRLELEKHFA